MGWREWPPLTDDGVSAMLKRRSVGRFGKILTPHIFRHALATTAINESPNHPGLAASILGNSAAVVEKSYAKADKIRAGLDYQAALAVQREDSADWAAELFVMRGFDINKFIPHIEIQQLITTYIGQANCLALPIDCISQPGVTPPGVTSCPDCLHRRRPA